MVKEYMHENLKHTVIKYLAKKMKNHTHVNKVGHTSEFLFGIYWWIWKTNIY